MNYIDSMDNIFKIKVLGSVTSPSYWTLKHSKVSEGQLQIDLCK